MKNRIWLSYGIVLSASCCFGQEPAGKVQLPTWDTAWEMAKQMGSGALNILGDFAQGFGYCPGDRTYNMQIWNDVPAPVRGVVQNITQFAGAQLAGQPIVGVKMNPFTNTGDQLSKLGGVCAGAIYLMPYTGILGTASYHNIIYDAETKDLAVGGAAGTAKYITTQVGSILLDLAGTLTGEGLIVDVALSNFAFFHRKFNTVEKDTSVYVYHAYHNRGKNQGEFLGSGLGSSSDFVGMFFNNTQQDVQLSFLKDGKKYTVTLEAMSFNALNSTPGVLYSIRPPVENDSAPFGQRRSFEFLLERGGKKVAIPIPSTGIGDTFTDAQKKTVTVPRTYTYEISSTEKGQEVGIQGVRIGNYDQPGVHFEASKTATLAALPTDFTKRAEALAGLAQRPPYHYPILRRLRDINPLTCLTWYQAAEPLLAQIIKEDANFEYDAIPFNMPYTLWFYYNTQDTGPVLKTLTSDQVTTVELLRPQIAEEESSLFVFALDTADTAKAQQFFTRLFRTGLPKTYYTAIDDPLNIPNIFSLVPDRNGIIDDTKDKDASGVRGYYLLKDTITPYGLGSGPFYYVVPPAYLIVSQLAGVVGAFIDTQPYHNDMTVLNKALMDLLRSWITYYIQNKQKIDALGITSATSANLEQAIPDLTSYLQKNGTEATKKNLNAALYTILFGPTSISKPPIIWQSGASSFTSRPEGWPVPTPQPTVTA